ncbi:DUF1217 domain-containing protein [Marivita sp. S6314]|uniref:DUF1217 domain-containing protein n=1 Tax=Marivita sp. S6314 TaxID=2926406 RepID=UPI001FF4CDA8|nr:DUF1217 domain-containing protein [Marivita sp. S6314]MCK0151415.1 DUF1217 domain-containing protein [Marivita sp. S6314]
MSFSPVLIGNGLQKWSLLSKTRESQTSLLVAQTAVISETEHFKSQFPKVETADDITSDRRLLKVVLGAYGLSEDLENRHFIKTIMEQGVDNADALANKLSDRRYRRLASDFDFSSGVPLNTRDPRFATQLLDGYKAESFAISVGNVDTDMRLALGFERALRDIVENAASPSVAWYQVLGTPPAKEVIQSALGLPRAFGNLSIDEQHDRMRSKAQAVFGTDDLSQLAQPTASEEIIERFLLLKQSQASATMSSRQTALMLLQSV